MNLYDPQIYKYTGKGAVIPVSLARGTPVAIASVSFNGRPPVQARFEVDTGGDSAFIINSPLARKEKLLSAFSASVPASSLGAGGEQELILGRAKAVSFEGLAIKDPVIGLSQDTEGSGAGEENDGIIGAEVFRRFKVILDYRHNRMILEPNKRFGDPFEVGMSGIMLGSDENDCKALKIDGVVKNSPAVAAGLRPGDVITAIDGKPADRFSSDEFERVFKQDGKERALTIRRGSQIIQTKIKLKRMI